MVKDDFAYNPETFQFHKGTIRTLITLSSDVVISHFNSIKVRLELSILAISLQHHMNFNSIKVRLELISRLSISNSLLLFQFHKGTIRTYEQHLLSDDTALFQFHKGTIRTAEAFIPCFSMKISIP